MNKKFPRRFLPYVIAAAITLALPAILGFDDYILHLLIIAGITVVLTTSLRLVFATGIWHVGQAAFYALGAYALHYLVVGGGLSFWAALPIAGLAAALVAWGFGYVTLRVKGVYFAILSLAFVEVVRLAITNIVGAKSSIVSTPPPNAIITPLFTIDFSTRVEFFYLMLGLVAVTLLFFYSLEKSRFGATLRFISESEDLAESIGIKVMRYELLAFVIGSFFAGMAGGFFASYNRVISPDVFTVWYSIILIVIMLVGGMYSFWGPPIGAAILVTVPTLLPSGAPEKMFYAVLVIAIIFVLPKGLVGLPEAIRTWLSRRKGIPGAEVATISSSGSNSPR